MKPKFISLERFATFIIWLKDALLGKVDKEDGKGLSANDFTDQDKSKLDNIESGAQVNLIESISINGDVQTINQKNVNIPIPLVDVTLKNSGQSADAKATGDAITAVNQSIAQTASAIRGEFNQADEELVTDFNNALSDADQSIREDFAAADVQINNTITQTASAIRGEFAQADTALRNELENEIQNVAHNVPTKTSELMNDSNFATTDYVDGEIADVQGAIPTKVSQLQNDSSYATTTELTNGLATKEDMLQYGTATSADVGKAMMPKTISDGKVTEWEFGEAGKVDDVQVNGTSILENKVANIPIATSADHGVVKANSLYGVGIRSDGTLQVTPAASPAIKSGMNIKTPITPDFQHESTFYGLAKAAGDTTQSSSSNAVGNYTDDAKLAIKSMLGFATSSDVSTAIDNLISTRYYVCQDNEYDPSTYIPTLDGELGIIYLVPKYTEQSIIGSATIGTAIVVQEEYNAYYEYIFTGSKFEKIGDTKIDLSDYLMDSDIATDDSVNTMLNQVFA